MADVLQEIQGLRRELEGVEGYLRKDTAARINEVLDRARQERSEDRVLAAIGPASEMPAAHPHSPGMDPSYADVRGDSGRAELEQAEAACRDASLHERVRLLRHSLWGTSGERQIPKRVNDMFEALMAWAREELSGHERLETIADPDPAPETYELSELTYGQAQATLGLIECELEHAGRG